MVTALILLILIVIEAIVIKVNDKVLCYMAGFALIAFGFGYWSTEAYIGLLAVVASIYNFARAIWAY